MKLDPQTTIELTKIIGGLLLDHLASLLLYLVIGFILGAFIAYLTFRWIRAKAWFKRTTQSSTKRTLLFLFRSAFYLSIIGLSSTIGLAIGSNRIVEKEVSHLVMESTDYCKTNFFNDYESVQSLFHISNAIYANGHQLNEINHKIAEAVANEVSQKQGLGLFGFLLNASQSDMTKQIEELEIGFVTLLVATGLNKIGAEELIEPDQIDKAFYAWIHSDKESSLGSLNEFMSTQICRQVKPLVFSIWLPFIAFCTLFILANCFETAWYFYQQNKEK